MIKYHFNRNTCEHICLPVSSFAMLTLEIVFFPPLFIFIVLLLLLLLFFLTSNINFSHQLWLIKLYLEETLINYKTEYSQIQHILIKDSTQLTNLFPLCIWYHNNQHIFSVSKDRSFALINWNYQNTCMNYRIKFHRVFIVL